MPKRKRSRDQARIWLSTVLSPMLRALDVEVQFVGRSNWSFRTDSQNFEYLWPTAMMIATPHRPNAEQLFRYHPSLKAHAAAHDRALEKLRDACHAAHAQLMNAATFQSLPLPPDQRPDPRPYFAEYVVNGLRDLPSHYVFADFWKTHGGEYLGLRSDTALARFFDAIETCGKSFERHAAALRRSVKQLQERIADEKGLAPVDPNLP